MFVYKVFLLEVIKTKNNTPKYNRKIVERGKVDTPNTQIHDRSLSWLVIGSSVKSENIYFPDLIEMKWPCKYFSHVS